MLLPQAQIALEIAGETAGMSNKKANSLASLANSLRECIHRARSIGEFVHEYWGLKG